jgi:hypothetical protein
VFVRGKCFCFSIPVPADLHPPLNKKRVAELAEGPLTHPALKAVFSFRGYASASFREIPCSSVANASASASVFSSFRGDIALQWNDLH